MTKPIYYLNGTNLLNCVSGVRSGVMVAEKIDDFLGYKTDRVYTTPSHGVSIRTQGMRYDRRDLTLTLYVYTTNRDNVMSAANEIRALFYADKPSRLTRVYGTTEQVWDVYYNGCNSFNRFADDFVTIELNLIEPAPVKHVYRASAASVSITTESVTANQTQEPLLISWGDGSFTENARAGTHSHTYDDAAETHYVIVSGVIEDVIITTDLTVIYSIRQ